MQLHATSETEFVCEVPTSYGDAYLRELALMNCGKVQRSIAELARAIRDGEDFGDLDQQRRWLAQQQEANATCSTNVLSQDLRGLGSAELRVAARHAINAWGSVIMGGRECCIYLQAPWCVDQTWSTSTVGLATPFAVLLVLFCVSCLSSWCRPPPSLDPAPLAVEPRELRGAAPRQPSQSSRRLRSELEEIWGHCCLREMPGARGFGRSAANLYAALQQSFDFQPDNVKNQFEHLVSLLRSHVSMVADRFIEQGLPVKETGLLEEALGDLHAELLDGFIHWRTNLCNCKAAQVRRHEDGPPQMGGCAWERAPGSLAAGASLHLAEVSLYLLCWGEAGNVRFMPEVIYFITELALKAEQIDSEGFDDYKSLSMSGQGGEHSGLFLSKIVRPLYNVVFDEWYDNVDVNKSNGRDTKKLHANFENFLPPDVANYDDWNEFFCSPTRLAEGLLLMNGTLLFDLPHDRRFNALSRVDWHVSLQAAEVKTHRELHSLWGVFATTHRVWLVHAVLFLCGAIWVTGDAPATPDGGEPVLGRDLATRFAAVGLVVPFHALLWKFAHQQVTGRGAWKQRSSRTCLLAAPLNAAFWAVPLATYGLVRLQGSGAVPFLDEVPRRALFAAHLAASGLGLFLLVFLPLGVRCDRPRALSWLLRPLCRMFSPPDDLVAFPLTPVPLTMRAVRYCFWAAVLAIKFVLWLEVLRSVFDATVGLEIALPGRHSLDFFSKVYLSTNWLASILLWLVLWCTAFLLFVSDTQLWFTLGCTVLGVATVFVQRGCDVCTWVSEDALAKIPERFSAKVLWYCTPDKKDKQDKQSGRFSPYFPAVWDRCIEWMRYEDKIDNDIMGDLAFEVMESSQDLTWERLRQPLVEPSRGPVAAGGKRVRMPDVFRGRGLCERWMQQCCNVRDPHWPRNADAQWRLHALSRGLGLPMPRPFRAPYIPGITVLVPHYLETILMVKGELFQGGNLEVPLLDWLQAKYADEFSAFTHRMEARPCGWPVAGSEWGEYTDEQWGKVTSWATMRMQTLWRTVAGMCLYHPALQAHWEVQRDKESSLGQPHIWSASDVFTCLVSMQMYRFFDRRMVAETDRMLRKFPDCLKVAYIDFEDRGPSAAHDAVHPRQKRRYFSCLIDGKCAEAADGRRKPRFCIELPGYPILGDGKGDNQNHAIPFMRGCFSQCIDANQGAYFEQMMLLPCALGEFRSHARGDGLSKRIIGFPEHITSDIGSIGDFAASAEVAFGTILQRTYAVLGARMHYGHPDIMNKVLMMQQGGVSKATKTVNLSEDIFAGMDFTLRGAGRKIFHKEYFHLAKGRDLGFNTVLGFFSKLSSGTGEQVLTRQAFRLSQVLHLPEALSFYYAHVGYYFTQFFVSISMPLLAFVWLLALLSDCEGTFLDYQHCNPGRRTAMEVMTNMLAAMFSWLIPLFLVATSLPLFAEVWMERNLKVAVWRMLVALCTFSPLMFIFQAKVIGSYVTNEFRYGGASYVATGRGLPTERRPFIGEAEERGLKMKKVGGLFLDYAAIAFYDGAMLLTGAVLIFTSGGLQSGAGYVFFSLMLTVVSWLFAPFIFNPYQFAKHHFVKDLRALAAFFLEDGGRHWIEWYDRTQLKPRKGFQTVNDIAFAMVAFFLAAWYGSLNLKIEALVSIYSGSYSADNTTILYVVSLLPPVGASVVYSILIVILEGSAGCSSMFRRKLEAMRERGRARRPSRGRAGDDEDPEEEEAGAHREDRDTLVRPAPPTKMKTTPFWDSVRKRSGCGLGIPLPVSALIVLALDILESGVGLYPLYRLRWWNGLLSGLILKWCMQMIVLFLAEGVLRARGFAAIGMFGLPIQLWVHSHKMLRDIITSSLIFWALAPFVLLNALNDCLCPGCSAHMLLVYRDPGHLRRKEAELLDLPLTPMAEGTPPHGPRPGRSLGEPKPWPPAEASPESEQTATSWLRSILWWGAAPQGKPEDVDIMSI